MAERRRAASTAALLLGALAAGALGSPAASAAPPEAAAPSAAAISQPAAQSMCSGSFVRRRSDDVAVANQIMAGQLTLPAFAAVPLPADPTWREDPYSDAKWKFLYHNWEWLDRLRRVGDSTGDQSMLDRWQFFMRDWLRDVPHTATAPQQSWVDMAVGQRAVMLACAIGRLGPLDWLVAAVGTHGAALADPAQYAGIGNHAMHQNNGLLALAVLAGRTDWRDLAVARNDALLEGAVDSQGVTDEGALGYQWSNYVWWSDARDRVVAAGLPVSPAYARVPRMLELVTYGTAPDGLPEMIGDTNLAASGYVKGTPTEYAWTRGASGPQPQYLNRLYRAGYAIGRSTWAKSGFTDATFWTVRFGPSLAGQVHGHADQGAVTLSSFGSRLLWDQGLYAFYGGAMRNYVRSAEAHNGVTVEGATYDTAAAAPVLAYKDTAAYTLTTVEIRSQKGARWTRTLFYSKAGRYLLIDDRVRQADGASRTAVQRFHLGADRAVASGRGAAATSGPGANVGLFSVGESPAAVVVKGKESPLMGWRTTTYGAAVPVPVLENRLTGADVRFTTVVVPRKGGAAPSTIGISGGSRTSGRATVTVRSGAVTEKVTVSATGATVTPL